MTLNKLADECHAIAREKGFWERRDQATEAGFENESIASTLALIHSEVSEALEAHRIGFAAGMYEELADIIIRVLDLAGSLGLDMDAIVKSKMARNRARERLHGKAY